MSTTDITSLPFDDTVDFDAAERGFIASGESVIRNDRGQVVWDNGSYTDFLTGDAPETVHPSLWRQSTLVAKQGLFEVTDGIYQVRGYDLSNISFVESDTGVIVIDPLISTETAAAALALYRASWRPGRRRRDPHAQPRRPLRRGEGGHLAGGRGRRQGLGAWRRTPHTPCTTS